MILRRFCGAALVVVLFSAFSPNVSAQVTLFEENFDSLLPTLGDSVNERVGTGWGERVATDPDSIAANGVWSGTPPTGWTVDKNLSTYDGNPTVTPGVPGQGLPDYGVDEWEGWNFARIDFWAEAADAQDRQLFGTSTGASGTAAVADGDEYFDLGSQNDAVNGGYYSSALVSPSFPVTGGGFYGVGFDSSWRDEAFDDSALGDTFVNQNNQSVEIIASFDAGADVQVVKWNSDSGDTFFKNDAPDENFAADGSNLLFEAPAGATSATLSFNYANAANDWWWAIDNIQVDDLVSGGTVLAEDFEGVTLGDSVNERIVSSGRVTVESSATTTILGQPFPTNAVSSAFTHTPPAGWSVDNTGTPDLGGDDGVGVLEWEQFSFTTREFWNFADRQQRENFDNASGVLAVADGDEWDDLGDPGDRGDLTTFIESPVIDISAVSGADLTLMFDSSWRAEDNQTAVVTAVLDGNPVEILRWESGGASPFFHGDNVNEEVAVAFAGGGASSLQLRFSYVGNNDWWWAIDNVKLTGVPEPAAMVMAVLAFCCLGAYRPRRMPPQ